MFVLIAFLLICPSLVHASILTPDAAADGNIIDGYIYNVGFAPKDGIPDQLDPLQSVQVVNNALLEERGIIEFDISSFTDPLTSAYLKLPVIAQLGPYPLNMALYGYEGNGILDNADFNNGTLLTSFAANGEDAFVFDVTPFIQDLKTTNGEFAGFNIHMLGEVPTGGSQPYMAFGSNEFPDETQLVLNEGRPNVAAEPASTALFIAGGLAMTFMFYKRRALTTALALIIFLTASPVMAKSRHTSLLKPNDPKGWTRGEKKGWKSGTKPSGLTKKEDQAPDVDEVKPKKKDWKYRSKKEKDVLNTAGPAS